MARFAISGRSSITPTTTLPGVSLYATSAVQPRVREVGIWNTTVTEVPLALVRLSTTGTQGAGLTEVPEDDPLKVAVATGFAGHSSTGPTLAGEVRRAFLGAARGAGIIFTFGPNGLMIPSGTGNGIGVICATGTGQVFDYYISWEE